MEKYYDADGVDITEKVKADLQTQIDAKVKEANDQLTVVQNENKVLKEKDTNFTELKTKYETETAELKKNIGDLTSSVITDKRNSAMKSFTGGNKEMNDKIEAELKLLNLPMTNAEEIESAITKAAAIVGVTPRNTFAAAAGHMGGRGSAGDQGGATAVETAEQRQFRLQMGISDEMATKHMPADSGVTPLIVDKPKA